MARKLSCRILEVPKYGSGADVVLDDNEVIRHIGFAASSQGGGYTSPEWRVLVVTSAPWTEAEVAELAAIKLRNP